ncbi:Glycosyltransferase involved in cell wall bisynthesis [Tangfeifania diversioriginum]|uniref:Glycosyltransferase involved in cell wall bisynthesis n=1 Tax=Tangfeifania diversioriginum TaxID=1168035 RepID=A0A1M6LM33_9BACT|nr:glycosyltransferase family 2 protein [Tangfeifania diversioriginum]SHJ72243.1 Glycosyltransferase involved in cell wall bisynthesis [Tangfeifania diversioriginum]
MKKLSLVICVYNEESNIKPLSEQIQKALDGIDYEAVFVDDGSSDKTRDEVRKINDERFILIELKRNYGQSSALQAGIDHADAEYIALIDGDLQNDPADIPRMLGMMEEEGWDMVAGVRANRKDGMFLRKVPSKIANYMIRKSTGTQMKDLGCTLKIFTRETIKSITIYGELHRFIPVLITQEGATRITQTDVNHRPRKFGTSKYNLNRTSKVLSDLILMLFFKKYLQRPMHLFGGLGFVTLGIGVLINIYLLILKILGNDIWGKPLLLLGILLVMGGIQFITIGIIAELQMRTYYESQQKKPYRIKNISSTGRH